MPTKVIGGKLFTLVVCSDETQDDALLWARENYKSPSRKQHWDSDHMIFGLPKVCNCNPKNNSDYKHYTFGCIINAK